jgi:S1-C subfamily serine protease
MDGKVIVTTVAKGGPADRAGIKVGEVITQFQGPPTNTTTFWLGVTVAATSASLEPDAVIEDEKQ